MPDDTRAVPEPEAPAVTPARPATPPASLKEKAPPVDQPPADGPRVTEEVVIEEVSIDGMCGVY